MYGQHGRNAASHVGQRRYAPGQLASALLFRHPLNGVIPPIGAAELVVDIGNSEEVHNGADLRSRTETGRCRYEADHER